MKSLFDIHEVILLKKVYCRLNADFGMLFLSSKLYYSQPNWGKIFITNLSPENKIFIPNLDLWEPNIYYYQSFSCGRTKYIFLIYICRNKIFITSIFPEGKQNIFS